jgi:hypothetical protein
LQLGALIFKASVRSPCRVVSQSILIVVSFLLKEKMAEPLARQLKREQFVDALDDEFTCCICHDVLVRAMACNNGLSACESCLDKWKARSNRCPACNCNMTTEHLLRNRMSDNLLDKKDVYCCWRDAVIVEEEHEEEGVGQKRRRAGEGAGCAWSGKLKDRPAHLTMCDFAVVNCPNVGCALLGIGRRNLGDHTAVCAFRPVSCQHCATRLGFCNLAAHEKTCPMASVVCACGVSMRREQLQGHKSSTCPLGLTECPFEKWGCKVKNIKRRDYAAHQTDAAASHSELMAKQVAAVINGKANLGGDKRELKLRIEGVAAKLIGREHDVRSQSLELQTSDGAVYDRLTRGISIP